MALGKFGFFSAAMIKGAITIFFQNLIKYNYLNFEYNQILSI